MKITYDMFCAVLLTRLFYEKHYNPLRIVHIGGYNGEWDLWQKENLSLPVEIFSFEPHPENYKKLQAAFLQDKKLHAIPLAIGGHDGQTKLYGRGQGSGIFPKVGDATFGAETSTLDSACATYKIRRIDLLRCNCEGAELDIFGPPAGMGFLQCTSIIHLCLHGKDPALVTNEMYFRKMEITQRILDHGFRILYGDISVESTYKKPITGHIWQVYVKQNLLEGL